MELVDRRQSEALVGWKAVNVVSAAVSVYLNAYRRGLSAKVADDASRSVASLLSDFALQKGNISLHK